ncbi:MAG TPA: Asp-tRNA(Asn)/Glu-tRNA(Gln) amidotransferase subunit GatC [Oceanipulchritudo sp.]|nr:Asp-tRNA(Asn)/Glu-tRNA(Gln) amidotransferase subunit GatC [Oceanipulchritudo sp.]
MQESPGVDIDKLARLSRIQLTEREKTAFSAQVADILGFFQKLQDVDVEGIPPMAHPFEADAPLREDVPATPWKPGRALLNAPASRENQVIVPKVIDDA